MTGRTLGYLASVDIERVPGLSGKRGGDLRKAGIASVADLLLHVPRRYVDRSKTVPLSELPLGEEVTVIGTVRHVTVRRPRKNLTIVEATVYDGEGLVHAVWFNQAFRERQLAEGAEVALSGKVERYRGRLQMQSPDADILDRPSESLITGRVMPVHGTAGSSRPFSTACPLPSPVRSGGRSMRSGRTCAPRTPCTVSSRARSDPERPWWRWRRSSSPSRADIRGR